MQPHGSPTNKIWVVVDKPYDNDSYILFDGGYGYHFHKMYEEAGLPLSEKFITAIKLDKSVAYDDEIARQDFISLLKQYKPPFIITLGEGATGALLPQTKSFKKPHKPRVESFAGSLLKCDELNYDHYATCTHPPDVIIGHWDYHDILVSLDFGRVREEWEYYNRAGHHNPLPTYNITVAPTYEELMDKWLLKNNSSPLWNTPYVSTDIETIRPRKHTTQFRGNPGFPYLMGLASDSATGLSFSLWDYDEEKLARVWIALCELLRSIPQIGQNYFNFDAHYLEAIGFELCLSQCQDTMVRHHLLWPELPHALQFLTKQYTRQPYYKDEGKGFRPSSKEAMIKFMYYNAFDAVVTYAVFNEQEKELNERPHLR